MASNVQPNPPGATPVDHHWLRYTFRLAAAALDIPDQPFAAVLVGDGGLLLEAVNQRERTGDCTAHAERLVCSEASVRWDLQTLGRFTLYSSTEPCLMCAGAFAWSGIGRLVFGMGQAEMAQVYTGFDPPRFPKAWTCHELLARTHPPVEVVGPLLLDEAGVPHRLWQAKLEAEMA